MGSCKKLTVSFSWARWEKSLRLTSDMIVDVVVVGWLLGCVVVWWFGEEEDVDVDGKKEE